MNKRRAGPFIQPVSFLLLIFFCLTSCSHVDFVAGGKTPFKISTEKNSNQSLVVEGTVDFYLWGISPGESKIDLEEIESKFGILSPSHVSVEHSIGFKNLLFTLITLGLYCPVDYKVSLLKALGPKGSIE